MDPDQVTQIFNRCPGCNAVVAPSDAACRACGRELADAAVERTMVLPRVGPTDGALVSPQTTIPLPAVRLPREPAYARPRAPVAPVRAERRGPRVLPILLLALLLGLGGVVYYTATNRPLTGGEFEPARPLPIGGAPPAAAPPTATTAPSTTAKPASAAPPAQPPAPAQWVVANTGGDGVYLRRTPKLDARMVAWPDNTTMVDLGEQATGDGLTWRKVRDPRGDVGYVPTQYLAPAANR